MGQTCTQVYCTWARSWKGFCCDQGSRTAGLLVRDSSILEPALQTSPLMSDSFQTVNQEKSFLLRSQCIDHLMESRAWPRVSLRCLWYQLSSGVTSSRKNLHCCERSLREIPRLFLDLLQVSLPWLFRCLSEGFLDFSVAKVKQIRGISLWDRTNSDSVLCRTRWFWSLRQHLAYIFKSNNHHAQHNTQHLIGKYYTDISCHFECSHFVHHASAPHVIGQQNPTPLSPTCLMCSPCRVLS